MKNKHNRNRTFKPHKKDDWRGNKKGPRPNRLHEKPQTHEKRPQQESRVCLREDQVGITEFVTTGAGFTGVVKSRYSDFQVNEIDLNGEVVVLNNLDVPKPAEDTLDAAELASAQKDLENVITPEVWKQIEVLVAAKGNEKVEDILIPVDDVDKERRTKIHQVLKKLYASKVISTTCNEPSAEGTEGAPERKFLKIMKPKGGRDQNRTRWTFPGDFVHFVVHKENMDTSEVAAGIASRLNMSTSYVNYCGTKDKRAKTTQKFCIKRRLPTQIFSASRTLRNVHVGNFEFSDRVLKLGDLKGNRFRIALRHVSGDEKAIEYALEQLRERGFINYFGLQRFGNCAAIPTYEVGVALLNCDYKLATELILKPRENDIPFMREVRQSWWKDRNSAAAAEKIYGSKSIEKKLLAGLAEYGEGDYATALRKIPRNMLLLYPHAFQSLVFNRIASKRVKEFGFKLIAGDLVYRDRAEVDVENADIEALAEEGAADTEAPENLDAEPEETEKTPDTESEFKRKVKALTEEDIASGAYTLFDVVLPLPGHDITYPANVVGTWYEEMLAEYGLSSEKLRHNVKTYAMAGAYRRMLMQPTHMTWQFQNYDSPEESLITSDWDALRVEAKKPTQTATSEGKFKALLLDFRLPTSVYATMLLRELLKTDTSATTQTQLERGALQRAQAADETAEKSLETSCKRRNSDEDAAPEAKVAKIAEVAENPIEQ